MPEFELVEEADMQHYPPFRVDFADLGAELVEEAAHSPSICVLCKSHVGPFVHVPVGLVDLPTPDGPVSLDGSLYLCVGRDFEDGCARIVGGLAGCLPVTQTAQLKLELEEARAKIAELEARPPTLNVVPVEELLARVGG